MQERDFIPVRAGTHFPFKVGKGCGDLIEIVIYIAQWNYVPKIDGIRICYSRITSLLLKPLDQWTHQWQ